jgi:hypothetical protein
MRQQTRDHTHGRSHRPPGLGSIVHAARRPRRVHSSRVRLVHAVGASLALAALSYLATAKAGELIGPQSMRSVTSASGASSLQWKSGLGG